jgi:hypothetical protein
VVRNNSYPAAAYDRQVIRVWLAVAASLVAGTSLTACGSTPGAAPGTSTLPPTPGELVTHVTSVTATLEPYNPQLTDQGVPAEQVNFIVTSVSGPFSCRVDVRRWGRIVGTTVATMGPPSGTSGSATESVPVEGIKGGTFAGNSSNALVVCRLS